MIDFTLEISKNRVLWRGSAAGCEASNSRADAVATACTGYPLAVRRMVSLCQPESNFPSDLTNGS